ncbi:MAG: hypothetical protein D0531_09030 [Methylococcales bacterium]|nr:MAG: hypothetical protein D0531_09030 [Methylococcales bacterium]
MQINFIYDLSCNAAPSAFKTALQVGADIIDKAIINPITVNIQVGWGENAGTAIDASAVAEGMPTPNQAALTYNQLLSALITTASLNNSSYLVDNLPETDPTAGVGLWTVYTAQALALNLPVLKSGKIDGSIGFSSGIDWGYSPTNLGANQADFIGTVIHEITHALGRVNASTGSMNQIYGVNDLYDYAFLGKLQLTTGTAGGYYSINGGATNMGNLDGSLNGDPADWTVVTDVNGGSLNGVAGTFSFIDLLVMQALGYKMAPAYQLAGATSVDNPVPTAVFVNEGEHDLISVQTVGVAPGTTVSYSISGIAANRLISDSLAGTVTIGADGTGTIDLGIKNNSMTDGATTATVTLAGNLASTSVIINDTSLAPDNIVTLPPNSTYSAQANQTINGISGLNKVVFSEPATNFTVSISGVSATLIDTVGTLGIETLNNIQRAVFNDGSTIALDFQSAQNGYLTAMMIGTAFGASKVSAYFAAGVSLYDQGQSNSEVATLIESLNLIENQIGSTTNSAWVDFVYTNVIGASNLADEAQYINGLNNGAYTKATLLALAAGVADSGAGSLAAQINLVGLQANGLIYHP